MPELEVDVPGTISHSLNIRSVNVFFFGFTVQMLFRRKGNSVLDMNTGPSADPHL